MDAQRQRDEARRVHGRFPAVEGLRGLAAAGVLLSHVFAYASPDGGRYELGHLGLLPRTSGVAGVVLFFTLSGFLLYRPFAASLLEGTRRPDVRSYFRNRFLRILPAYWLALIGTGLVLRTAYVPPLQVEGRSLATEPTMLAANLLLVQGYSPSTLMSGIGPAWSLVVEMAFYLTLPALAGLAFLLGRHIRVGRRWLAALAPAAVLLVLGQVGWKVAQVLPGAGGSSWSGTWHAVAARSFLTHAGLFAAGLTLAVLHVQVRRGVLRLPPWWRGAALGGALLLGGATSVWYDEGRLSENRATLAFSIGFALLLAAVVLPGRRRSRLEALLSSVPLQLAGLISYGVFLWHEPVVWWLNRQGWTLEGTVGFALALVTTMLVAGALAGLSWRLVERPALSLKSPAARARTAPPQEVGVEPVIPAVRAAAAEPGS